jgi:hypothetical protein
VDHSSAHRTGWLVVVVLLALGLALRLTEIGHGLPWIVGPDEGFEIHRALRLGQGSVDLERVHKGGYFYLLFAEYGIYYLWLRLTGAVGSSSDFAARFATDITPFWMIARVTHAVLAALVIVWTFLLGRKAYDWRAGAIGAAVVTVSSLHVVHAHYVGVDLPMTLLALMTLGVAVDWARETRPRRPVAAGLLYGAAMATKVPAALLGIPILVAHWLRRRRSAMKRVEPGHPIAVCVVVAVMTFVFGQPGILLDARRVFLVSMPAALGMSVTSDELASDPSYMEPGVRVNLWAYYSNVLNRDLGVPMLAIALAGVGYAVVKRRRADLVLLSFVVPLFVMLASMQSTHLYYPRYLLPVVPIVAILGGRCLAAAADAFLATRSVVSRGMNRVAVWGPLAIAIVLVLPMVSRSLDWLASYRRDDSRLVARIWFEQNVAPGSRVFLIGDPKGSNAPALSLPIAATVATASLTESDDPVKAEYLRLRSSLVKDRPAYDLHAARHFEPVRSLVEYEREGVEYFVLTGDHFSAARLNRDKKHAPRILESRRQLLSALESHPRAKRVFDLDPERRGLQGPSIQIYQIVPTGDSTFIEALELDRLTKSTPERPSHRGEGS